MEYYVKNKQHEYLAKKKFPWFKSDKYEWTKDYKRAEAFETEKKAQKAIANKASGTAFIVPCDELPFMMKIRR